MPKPPKQNDISLPIVNRSLLVLFAKQPFVDWLNRTGTHADLDEVNVDPPSFLTPEIFDEEDAQLVQEHYAMIILEEVLSSWVPDEDRWPRNLSPQLLHEWFDVIPASTVVDLHGKEPLEYSEE